MALLRVLWMPLLALAAGLPNHTGPAGIPILVYHRIDRAASNIYTVTPASFERQMRQIHDGGYHVIPLRELISYRRGAGPAPPPRSVIVTADDGHASVFTEMAPIVKRYRIPVTLFIYPSALSHAKWALTWTQLADLESTGLFDIQSHTYWHPNFAREKQRLSGPEYGRFVAWQLGHSKSILERRLGKTVDLMAWPFGIYDDDLIRQAESAGYIGAVSIERRPVRLSDGPMSLPRFIVTDDLKGAAFDRVLEGG